MTSTMHTNGHDERQYAPATERNSGPILDVLQRLLPGHGTVLEVASGTGEHAAWFAPRLAPLDWQPSDPDPVLRASIAAWTTHGGVKNLSPPLDIDVASDDWGIDGADAIVCINLIHIAPWSAALGLLRGAGRLLPPDGVLYLYGPFRIDGAHTAPSNEAFDHALRRQNPTWGVRDLAAVAAEATRHGLMLSETVSMPSNNLSVIFRRI